MKNKTSRIQRNNNPIIIPQSTIEQLITDRDEHIKYIESITEIKRKLQRAQTPEEYKSIHIPDEFSRFGEHAISVMDSYVSGFTLATDSGEPRCYYGSIGSIASVLHPTLFRGELQDYGATSGYSSLGRKLCSTEIKKSAEDNLFDFFVEQIRRVIFWGFLTKFRQYREFPYGEPMDGLIAQHYGLATSFLDLTDDIKVALFFACCIHTGNNQYRPINKNDIMRIGKMGVLYCGSNDYQQIIGFQPFSRCHRQRGYYIDTAAIDFCWKYTLAKDANFRKCFFDRNVELSERLYSEFDGGKRLFPNDGLEPFSVSIAQIANESSFPYETFEGAYTLFSRYLEMYYKNSIISEECYNSLRNKDYLKNRLTKQGFSLCNSLRLRASNSLINEMNMHWDPIEFAHKEGIVHSPFIVCDV